MNRSFVTILVTGGSGFIGSNFIHHLFEKDGLRGQARGQRRRPHLRGQPREPFRHVSKEYRRQALLLRKAPGHPRPGRASRRIFAKHKPGRRWLHFAAESHVDRSILGPEAFVTHERHRHLHDARRGAASRGRGPQGHALPPHQHGRGVRERSATRATSREETPYDPRSPYSASQGGLGPPRHGPTSHTYGLPVTLIELLEQLRALPVPRKAHTPHDPQHARGQEPCRSTAMARISATGSTSRTTTRRSGALCARGRLGESLQHRRRRTSGRNIMLLGRLMEIVAKKRGVPVESYRKLLTYVKDRPGGTIGVMRSTAGSSRASSAGSRSTASTLGSRRPSTGTSATAPGSRGSVPASTFRGWTRTTPAARRRRSGARSFPYLKVAFDTRECYSPPG